MIKVISILFLISTSAFADLTLANRFYISDVLLNVFGENGHTIIYENVMSNGQVFGGSCDFYEQVRIKANEYANPVDRNCLKGKQEYAYRDRYKYTKLRDSLMLQTCNALINCPKCFQYFLSKIDKSTEPVLAVLNHFFWNEQIIIEVLPSYQKIYDRYLFTSKKMKMVILNACTDPRWQKI